MSAKEGTKKEGEQGAAPEGRRTAAEWATFGVSLLIVAAMIGFILYLQFQQEDEARIRVEPMIDSVRNEEGSYYLPVKVENTGGKTAESITVEVVLSTAQGEPEVRQITIPFLAGGSSEQGVVVFPHDPATGKIESKISYLEP